jgi:predicted ATPase/DNA-binding SARP family transcriptional activator/Tfp pilus assembly protein PilF
MVDIVDSGKRPTRDEGPVARLVLRLLGSPDVLVDGEPASGLGSQKLLALLAYLSVEPHRQHLRSRLVALLWPDQPAKQAYQNLRKSLYRLRRAIGDDEADPPHLLSDSLTLQFNPQGDHWSDVGVFKALLSNAEHHRHRRLGACRTCVSRLARAAELYRGDFLAGLGLPHASAFDQWLLLERERFRQQASSVFHTLASAHLARGEPEEARRQIRRLLQLDPWNEPGQRLLLRSLTLSDGRAAALHQFEAFRRTLADELGVEPEDETLALVDRIRAGELADVLPPAPATSLPVPATPFVGREAERQRITAYLTGQDQRLITLCGPGGSGKTRLAVEIATEQAPLWRDGVWFIPLAQVPDAEHLVEALVTALDLPSVGSRPAPEDLVGCLRAKEMLLILDGFECLVDGGSLLRDILRWAPEMSILVTSRARLGLSGEWAVQLGGLDAPRDTPATAAEATDYGAVKLFLQNARRVSPDFALSPENVPAVIRICRLLEGLPLGIQLAAPWVRVFPCRQIADEIERSLDFLQNPGRDVPERQHSLRSTFDYSYNLLSETGRDVLRKLSVFQGGFTPEAAQEVAGAEPLDLASLVDKSLLQNASPGRFELHLTLRQYAAEKLASAPEEQRAARKRHASTFLSFVQRHEGRLRGEHPKAASREIDAELANVRAAWRSAVAEGMTEEVAASIGGLSRFYGLRGLFREAATVFGDAADRVLALPGETTALGGRLLVEQARFLIKQSAYEPGIQIAKRAVDLAQAVHDDVTEAASRRWWGQALFRQGEYDAAQAQLEQAVALAQTAQAPEVEADSLGILGGIRWSQGDYAGVTPYLERALRIYREIGNRGDQAGMLNNLGITAVEQGNYSDAGAYYEEALRVMEAIGDRQSVGAVLNNLGNVYRYVGYYTQALMRYEESLRTLRDVDDRTCEANTLGNLGMVHHSLGDDEAARAYSQQALRIAQEAGQRPQQAFRLLYLGDAYRGMGQLEEASHAYRQAVDLRRELNQPNLAAEARAGLARVALAAGDLRRSQMEVEEILRYLEADAPPGGSGHPLDGAENPAMVYLTCYRVLAANEDRRAPRILAAAHSLVEERAAKVEDEVMRRSFLENVAAHREIVELYETLDPPSPRAIAFSQIAP